MKMAKMSETRRVLGNKKWLALWLLFLLCALSLYVVSIYHQCLQEPSTYYDDVREIKTHIGGTVSSAKVWIENEMTQSEYWLLSESFVKTFYEAENIEVLNHFIELHPDLEENIMFILHGGDVPVSALHNEVLHAWYDAVMQPERYRAYIYDITSSCRQILSHPSSTFVSRNAEKTLKDFEQIQTRFDCPYMPIVEESILQCRTNLLFMFISAILTISFILDPASIRMEPLVQSTKKGVRYLTIERITILLIISVLSVSSLVVAEILIQKIVWGNCIQWGYSIHYLPLLNNWTSNDTIFSFLLKYLLFSSMVIFFVALLLFTIVFVMRKRLAWVYSCYSLLVIELFLYERFDYRDSLYLLSSLNIFHFLAIRNYIANYTNTSILGWPVSERALIIIGLFAGIFILISVLMRILKRSDVIPDIKMPRHSIKTKKSNSLFFLEIYKNLFSSRRWLLLVVGVVVLSINVPQMPHLNRDEEIYWQYVDRFSGPISWETYQNILNEKVLAEGVIEGLSSEGNSEIKEYYESKRVALNSLCEKYESLLSRSDLGKVVLVNHTIWTNVYGELGKQYRLSNSILSIFLLAVCLPSIILQEINSQMGELLVSSKEGGTFLWQIKSISALGYTVSIWLIREVMEFSTYIRLNSGPVYLFADIICFGHNNIINGRTALYYILILAGRRLVSMLLLMSIMILSALFANSYIHWTTLFGGIISLVYILEQSNGVLHDYLVDGIEPLKIEMIMVTGICVLLLQTVIKRVLRRMNYV